jgi:hypothetical protein
VIPIGAPPIEPGADGVVTDDVAGLSDVELCIVGVATPANATIVDLIHAYEARAVAGDAPDFVTPAQWLARIRAAGAA